MAEVIESATFRRWIGGLKDRAGVARINARLRNVSLGNTGIPECWPTAFEMRVHHGPGYRLYCRRDGDAVVVPCGGNKGSQPRDMERAGRLASEWRRR